MIGYVNKKGHIGIIIPIMLFVIIAVIGFGLLLERGSLDNKCNFKYAGTFEINSFDVSAGGFGTLPLINIKTTNGESKVMKLYEVYNSINEISSGDIIVYEKPEEDKFYCREIRYKLIQKGV